MISLNLKVDDRSLLSSVDLLRDKLQFELCADGLEITVFQSEELCISFDGKVGQISYVTRASFFRMFTLFIRNYEMGESFYLKENIEIKECGISLDLARGGVMKTERLIEYMKYMAMMGLNFLFLYLEDVYTIPELPYFGYMRGRYTEEELKEIDACGVSFGIEVIPVIQTMAHLEQYLKWGENWNCRNSSTTLLVGCEDTYKLIDKMLATMSRCFTTKKIHLGLDEAFDLNKGEYMKRNGLRDMKKVVAEHLERVLELTDKYGFEPMAWGWIDHTIGEESELIKNIQSVDKMTNYFYDYLYRSEEAFVNGYKNYLKISPKVGFLGAIWTWVGATAENRLTFDVCDHFLPLCKKYGIQNVGATVWGDDGNECNHFYTLLGAQIYAEHMYNREVSREHVKQRFEWTVETSYDAFMDMSDFHLIPDKKEYGPEFTLSYLFIHALIGKKLMWQDVMQGLMDYQLQVMPMSQYYYNLAEKFKQYKLNGDRFSKHYHFLEEMFDALALKCYIAENLKKKYDEGDKVFLQETVDKFLPELSMKIDNTRKSHRELWNDTYKPFGFEVIDVRYGGLSARIDSAIYRLGEYLDGRVEKLEELEEVRLKLEVQGSNLYNSEFSACSRRY